MPSMPGLSALLPKTVPEWAGLIQAALLPPVQSVWFPDHFHLQQRDTHLRYLPQKQTDIAMSPDADKRSAVLVLFSPTPTGNGDGFQDMCITLTKRTTKMRKHKGQMSFPGGHIDAGETAAQAAQREAHEEVGLAPDSYTILGELTPIPSTAAGASATPQVAISHQPVSPVIASPDEVASIHYIHLSTLLLRAAEQHSRLIKYKSFRAKVPSYFPCFFASPSQSAVTPPVTATPNLQHVPSDDGFAPMLPDDFPGELVWGLTSFMLCELTARVAKELEARHPDNPAAQTAAILRCTSVLARDPDSPVHQ